MATLLAIHVSAGGVPKRPVPQARIGAAGVEGDRQAWSGHGGPLRAVCLWSAERIEALRAEGHPVAPGLAGENLTVAGLDWARVAPGAELQIGEVRLRVTSYTKPCRKIAGCFTLGDFDRILEERHPGWSRVYASVVTPGLVRAGDPVELLPAG